MNCDCISKQEARILEGFRIGKLEVPPRAGEPDRVRCDGAALSLATGEGILGITFNAYFSGRKASFPVRMKAEFCPFCGTSAGSPEAATGEESR